MKPARQLHLVLFAALLPCFQSLAQPGLEVFTPSNPPEMKPIPNHNTPAYHEAKLFLRGANLGDYLEANRNHRSVSISANDFAQMKKEGFDHVRVPIGWHQYAEPGPDFILEPEIFSLVDFVVTNALQNKLAVMINIHHFNALDHDPATPPRSSSPSGSKWPRITKNFRNSSSSNWNEPHENDHHGADEPDLCPGHH